MNALDNLTENDVVLDALPDDVVASIEVRNKYLNNVGMTGGPGLEFIVADLQRWVPGQTVRIAFLDGDNDLHDAIAGATTDISQFCNLIFDFGKNESNESRRWSESDTTLNAEIRVSFDKNGYFSLVGTDSINSNIGSRVGRVGGRANQCSLNLGGYANQLPPNWQGTVRHEFLHALGFHHSHQNMRGPCQDAFRWDDDLGYQPTQDGAGRFIPDITGNRPGIYTYLAGFPNFWNRTKVDHNLKTEEDPGLIASSFDSESVMLYRFPEMFYKTIPSPCAPIGNGENLSAGDRRGLQLLYPVVASEMATVIEKQKSIVAEIQSTQLSSSSDIGHEVSVAGENSQLKSAASILSENLLKIE